MKRLWLIAVVLPLIVAACGREGGLGADLAVGGATATPKATTKAPGATATAAAGAAPTPTTKVLGAQVTPGPAEKPPAAAQGGVNTPKDGRYIYDYRGEASSPFNPQPQRFEGELTTEVSHQGNVYQRQQTTTVAPGRTTTRSRWEKERIVLLYIKIETQAGDFTCAFDPPLLIAKIPIKAETFPTQSFKGNGNACNGKLDISVIGREPAKDASGRSWSTWRVRVRTQTTTDQGSQSSDQTQWFSPELGMEIRTQGSFQGQFGATKFGGNDTSVLKSRP